jgi:hypothetical protein
VCTETVEPSLKADVSGQKMARDLEAHICVRDTNHSTISAYIALDFAFATGTGVTEQFKTVVFICCCSLPFLHVVLLKAKNSAIDGVVGWVISPRDEVYIVIVHGQPTRHEVTVHVDTDDL